MSRLWLSDEMSLQRQFKEDIAHTRHASYLKRKSTKRKKPRHHKEGLSIVKNHMKKFLYFFILFAQNAHEHSAPNPFRHYYLNYNLIVNEQCFCTTAKLASPCTTIWK